MQSIIPVVIITPLKAIITGCLMNNTSIYQLFFFCKFLKTFFSKKDKLTSKTKEQQDVNDHNGEKAVFLTYVRTQFQRTTVPAAKYPRPARHTIVFPSPHRKHESS